MLQSRCRRKVNGSVPCFILFGLTENSILMNEIFENTLNEELSKLFLVKIQMKMVLHFQSATQNVFSHVELDLPIDWLPRIVIFEIQPPPWAPMEFDGFLRDYPSFGRQSSGRPA